jgi:hypothetical protein
MENPSTSIAGSLIFHTYSSIHKSGPIEAILFIDNLPRSQYANNLSQIGETLDHYHY